MFNTRLWYVKQQHAQVKFGNTIDNHTYYIIMLLWKMNSNIIFPTITVLTINAIQEVIATFVGMISGICSEETIRQGGEVVKLPNMWTFHSLGKLTKNNDGDCSG